MENIKVHQFIPPPLSGKIIIPFILVKNLEVILDKMSFGTWTITENYNKMYHNTKMYQIF